MFTIICCIFLSAYFSPCNSAETISGIIKDKTTRAPLAGAFICCIHENTISARCFSATNGVFVIEVTSPDSDMIQISLLGYKRISVPAVSLISDNITEIQLTPHPVTIKAARISAAVMEESGDTITFTAGAFKESEDLTVGDLLQKLPGIVVSESGGILHNGEYINKFYIEGLDLMGSRYGTITRNLSAENIDKIEIYRNHQPIKALRDIVTTDRSAVNIILKESARSTWMFNGDIALGLPKLPLFETRVMISRFAKQSQDLYLIKGNNIGFDLTQEIREQSYFGRSGAFLISNENIDTDFQSDLNPRRMALELPQKFWSRNTSGLASFNHLTKSDSDMILRISAQVAAENFSESSEQEENIHLQNDSTIVIQESNRMTDKKYYMELGLLLEKNTEKTYWSDNFRLSGQWREADGTLGTSSEVYDQSYKLPSFKMENNFSSVIPIKGQVLNISSKSSFVRNTHTGTYSTPEGINLNQSQNINLINSFNTATYSLKFKPLQINLATFLNLSYVRRSAHLSSFMTDEPYYGDHTLYAGRVQPGISASTRLKKRKSDLFIHIPVNLNIDYGELEPRVQPTIAPSANYTYRLTPLWELSTTLNYIQNISDVTSDGTGYILTDYRRLVSENRKQRNNTVSSMITMNFSDNPSMFYFKIGGNYNYYHSDTAPSSLYKDHYILVEYISKPISSNTFGINGNVSKFFGINAFVTEFDANFQRHLSNEYIQGSQVRINGNTMRLKLSARTSALKWLSAKIDAKYVFNLIETPSKLSHHNFTAVGHICLKPIKPLQIEADIHKTWMYGVGESGLDLPIVSGNIKWLFKKFSLFGECRNMLNVENFYKEFINSHRIFRQTYRLRGREFLIGLRMSI